jgi:SAM-dependent methyltransferase
MPREFKNTTDITEWAQSLDDRWPERRDIMQHISEQLQRVPFLCPNILELCCGPGMLAEFLLRESSRIFYRGIDASHSLITFCSERLSPFGNRVVLYTADLNEDLWLEFCPDPIHAVISMQSLHDLGDESAVERIYRLAHKVLTRGGMLLNADLITPEKPGRLPADRHLELLKKCKYENIACTLQKDSFVCITGFKGPL